MKLEPVAEGKLTANGTEQTMVECPDLAILEGFVNLGNMQAGDSIIIRQYVMINSNYTLYAQETYNGVTTEPALHITPRAHKDKTKITLEQTAGSYRDYDYEFVREV